MWVEILFAFVDSGDAVSLSQQEPGEDREIKISAPGNGEPL
jgi:hypothetical protein